MPILPDAKKYLREETHEQKIDRAIAHLLQEVKKQVTGRTFTNADKLFDYLDWVAYANHNQFGNITLFFSFPAPRSKGQRQVLHTSAIRLYAMEGNIERAYDIIPIYNAETKSISIAIVPVGHQSSK